MPPKDPRCTVTRSYQNPWSRGLPLVQIQDYLVIYCGGGNLIWPLDALHPDGLIES